MNFDIAAVGPTGSPKPVASSSSRADRVSAPAAHTSEDSVRVDTIPSSPPPEVHTAMAVAADSYDRLHAAGRALSFQVDDATGKLHISVHDLNGNVLFTVPPSKALDIAGGGSLD